MLTIDIDIIEIIPETNAWTFRYRANRQLKNPSFYKSHIFSFLCQEFYTDGLRASHVEELFLESLEKKDYKYLIAFLRDHHKV